MALRNYCTARTTWQLRAAINMLHIARDMLGKLKLRLLDRFRRTGADVLLGSTKPTPVSEARPCDLPGTYSQSCATTCRWSGPSADSRPSPTRHFALAYLTKPKHTPSQNPPTTQNLSSKNNHLENPYQIPEVRRFREKWPLRARI